MAVVYLLDNTDRERTYMFYCPGCRYSHFFRDHCTEPSLAVWRWNGDYDRPTVHPSIDVFRDDPTRRCHFHITDGQLQFLSDCHHALRGTSVAMEPDD